MLFIWTVLRTWWPAVKNIDCRVPRSASAKKHVRKANLEELLKEKNRITVGDYLRKLISRRQAQLDLRNFLKLSGKPAVDFISARHLLLVIAVRQMYAFLALSRFRPALATKTGLQELFDFSDFRIILSFRTQTFSLPLKNCVPGIEVLNYLCLFLLQFL